MPNDLYIWVRHVQNIKSISDVTLKYDAFINTKNTTKQKENKTFIPTDRESSTTLGPSK